MEYEVRGLQRRGEDLREAVWLDHSPTVVCRAALGTHGGKILHAIISSPETKSLVPLELELSLLPRAGPSHECDACESCCEGYVN